MRALKIRLTEEPLLIIRRSRRWKKQMVYILAAKGAQESENLGAPRVCVARYVQTDSLGTAIVQQAQRFHRKYKGHQAVQQDGA